MDFGPASSRILPIPIRPGVSVFVQDLPHNLSRKEAKKIANVVLAMATADTPNSGDTPGPSRSAN